MLQLKSRYLPTSRFHHGCSPEGQDHICPCNLYHPPDAIPVAMRQIIPSVTHPPNSLDVVDTRCSLVSSGIRWGERRCSSDVHPRLSGVSRSREPRPCIHALAVITLHCITGPHGLSLTRLPELRPGSSLGLTGLSKAVYFERRAFGCRFSDGSQVLLPTTDIAERQTSRGWPARLAEETQGPEDE